MTVRLKVGAKVKCINNTGYETILVLGNVYTLKYDQQDAYLDIVGKYGGYAAYRFVVVCPCGITKCITNHAGQEASQASSHKDQS